MQIYDEAVNILKLVPTCNSGLDNHTRSISVSLPPSEGLVLTGSVKVVDNQTPLPLSMVLEELSGSEERRGSCSSVTSGSIPKLTERKRVDSHLTNSQPTTVVKRALTFPSNQSPSSEKIENSKEHSIRTNTLSKDLQQSSEKIPGSSNESEEGKILDSSDVTSSLSNSVKDLTVTQPVKKTVFSLLSQMDNVPASRRRGDGENLALHLKVENEKDVSKSNDVTVPDIEEPCSPVRLLSCRLESGDGSDIRPLSSGSVDDQERSVHVHQD